MSGRFLGIIGLKPSVFKSDWLHVVIFWFLKTDSRYIPYIYMSKMISNFLEILNFNWLLLKLSQFICN